MWVTIRRLSPAPPKVVVLTMTPSGGAMLPALRQLGYNPYTFENTYRLGNAMSHTKEWSAVLQHQKPFDPVLLSARKVDGAQRKGERHAADIDTLVAATERGFDSLVGPPATLAYEAILRTCPRSTRVILVEEPDKLTWEKEYEQLIAPVWKHTRSRGFFLGIVSDLHKMVDGMTDLHRAVSAPKAPNTSGSAARNSKRLGALQASALKPGAALDLFEAQVKETVPRDRLLVYRMGEGWAPLCQFLDKPIPTTTDEEGHRVPLAFPPHRTGSEVFTSLQHRLDGADRVTLVIVLVAIALALVVTAALNTPANRLVRRYRDRFNGLLRPYVEEHREDNSITLRGTLRLSKKATMELEEELRQEGGAISGIRDAIGALVDPYGKIEKNKAPVKESMGDDERGEKSTN